MYFCAALDPWRSSALCSSSKRCANCARPQRVDAEYSPPLQLQIVTVSIISLMDYRTAVVCEFNIFKWLNLRGGVPPSPAKADGSSEELVNVHNGGCIARNVMAAVSHVIAVVSPVMVAVISRHGLNCILAKFF